MPDHDHNHNHNELSEMDLRVRALQSVLTQKGYIDPAALDVLIDTYQTRVWPRNGARVVARSWVDPQFRDWLLRDATQAIASLGYSGRQGEHMVALEKALSDTGAPAGNSPGLRVVAPVAPVARADDLDDIPF